MGLSILEFVFSQLKKSAKFLVFLTSLGNIPREHTVKHRYKQRNRYEPHDKVKPHLRDKKRKHRVNEEKHNVCYHHAIPKLIHAVSAVHKAVQLVFKFSHKRQPIIRCEAPLQDPS